MAKLGFSGVNGAAKTGNYWKIEDGDNSIRVFGNIVPRYVYWIKNGEKSLSVECLAFDRETETFNNSAPDPVKDAYPDLKCGWSYAVQGIDLKTGKVVVFVLKKKLFEQIRVAMDDIGGDPCDTGDSGWPLIFTKKKTGPSNFNVEYTFKPLAAAKAKGPVTPEQLKLINEARPIEEILKRPTVEEVRKQVEQFKNNVSDDDAIDDEVAEELVAN